MRFPLETSYSRRESGRRAVFLFVVLEGGQSRVALRASVEVCWRAVWSSYVNTIYEKRATRAVRRENQSQMVGLAKPVGKPYSSGMFRFDQTTE